MHQWSLVCSLYSPLPDSQTLIVWRADEAPILVNEGDGVDSTQVAIVLLDHLTCPDVPLSSEREQTEKKQRK